MAQQLYSCTDVQLNELITLVGDANKAQGICQSYNVAQLGAQGALIQHLLQQQKETNYGLDTMFTLASGYQVFVMQLGFALYAAGVVRAKNVTMILLKNMVDACIACISFWLVGYAFAFGNKNGANGFIGNWDFGMKSTSESFPAPYQLWFWNWAFCAASTTILSGSIAERATFHSYLIYSSFMTSWVYPVVAHWLWSEQGWLSARNPDSILGAGAMDFAGSGVVHMVGGFASIIGSIATGPRTGRFEGVLPPSAFKGNSAPLYVLGTFMLWFGWYGFNPGSHLAIHNYDYATAVARTAVASTLAAGAGALGAMFLHYYRTRTWDLLQTCTGALAGLVAVTAGCPLLTTWASVICGLVAGVVFVYGELLVEYLQVDDPVSAFPLHGLCGMWGLLFVGLLAEEGMVNQVYGKELGKGFMGIFYGGHGQILLCQFIAILVIIGWTCFWMGLLFYTMKVVGILRVPLETEAMGLDRANCGDMGSGMDVRNTTKIGPGKDSGYLVAAAAPLYAMKPVVNTNPAFKSASPGAPSQLLTINEGASHPAMEAGEQSAAGSPAGGAESSGSNKAHAA